VGDPGFVASPTSVSFSMTAGGSNPPSQALAITSTGSAISFSHPMKRTHTGEILDVEPGEAEWSLDVLEAQFDFYFVQPAQLQKKRDELSKKLAAAGKL